MSWLLSAAFFLLQAAAPDIADGREQLEALEAEQAEREARQEELAKAARDAAAEAADLQKDMVALGDEIATLEKAASEAETRLAALGPQEEEAAAALEADRADLMRVLAALQRAEMRKPPPLAVQPDDAADAARAAMLLGAIGPELAAQADEVRARIESLARLRAELDAETRLLAEAQAGLDARRADLAESLEERQALERSLRADAEAEAEAAKEIAAQASSLGDLIARLEAEAERARQAAEAARRAEIERQAREQAERERQARELAARRAAESEAERNRAAESRIVGNAEPRPAPPPAPAPREPFKPTGRAFADARGALRSPAEGPIVARFGAPRDGGPSQGVAIATRAQAQVVAPFDARVEFADEFGNYGRMLILSVGDGYHIILAGLGRLYAVQGQDVLAGEPLGEMASQTAPAPELYYEIRQGGAPVDPAPWMRAGPRAG